MTKEEIDALVAELDAINEDPEQAHGGADEVLLKSVPAEIREAYERCEHRVGGFWYA